MDSIFFADIIGNVSVSNGLLRMDLYNEVPLAPGQQREQGTPPQYVCSKQVVLPLTAFLQAYSMFGNIVKQLEQTGAISITPAQADEDIIKE
ncbi:hypothetical protein LJC26_04705 [Desulfovibrio sp. OttesenSCG-928-O18]|nr:hypothetical protein [Desulfovibrio sp. OttesenSCG-928-O18]